MYCFNVNDVMPINMTICELCFQCALPLDPGSEVYDDSQKNCDLYWLWKNVAERFRTQAFSSLAKILTFWSILALRLFFSDVITHKRSIDAFARPLQSSRKLLQAQPIVFNNFNQVRSWLKKLIKQTNQKRSPFFNRRKVFYQPNETKTVLTNRTRLKTLFLKTGVAICWGVNFPAFWVRSYYTFKNR